MDAYDDLWQWSVDDLDGFWGAVWDFFDVIADAPYTEALADRSMPGATWFPGARLNYAEHALWAGLDDKLADEPAIITITESGERTETTWRELRRQVGSVAAWLRDQGVGQGDRVVGYLPNTHHTLIAFLATASVGAIWSACAQDYAAEGAATKLGQLEPAVLFTDDNRQGVRLGSADIYDVVDGIPEVAEFLVIGAEQPEGGYWMPLFVVLASGVVLDSSLRGRIAGELREKASPRHVPDAIIAVPAIPHTRTGKKLEVPVKRLIQGHALDRVANPDAVDSFEALAYFARFAGEAGAQRWGHRYSTEMLVPTKTRAVNWRPGPTEKTNRIWQGQ